MSELGSSSITIKEGDTIAPSHHKWEGTAGYRVKERWIVTNKHVAPDVGLEIIAPQSHWKDGPKIGRVTKTVKWRTPTLLDLILYIIFGRPLPANKVDASLIETYRNIKIERWLNSPEKYIDPKVGMVVHKRGRTTGENVGEVLDESVTINVDMGDGKIMVFTDVFRFSNKTAPGDSGGPLLSDSGILGITFAAPESGDYGFGVKSRNIEKELLGDL